MAHRKNIKPSWESVVTLAAEYRMTDRAVRKMVTRMGLSRPTPNFWIWSSSDADLRRLRARLDKWVVRREHMAMKAAGF